MKFLIFGLLLAWVARSGWALSLERVQREVSEEKDYFVREVDQYGYPVEVHKVVTEDGYILTVHRIPGRPGEVSNSKKPAVVLVHGLVGSSILFVIRGPSNSLSFSLVDAGYDVWHLNTRGNTYSREHVRLSPDSKEFWKFSLHEYGAYDLAALIDYILPINGLEKVSVIGHSMGVVVNLVLLSARPEYNKKVNVCINLAPAVIFSQVPPGFNWAFAIHYGRVFEIFMEIIGIHSFIPDGMVNRDLVAWFCSLPYVTNVCTDFVFWTLPYPDYETIDRHAHEKIMRHYPDRTSIDSFEHYRRVVETGTFGFYDWGPKENYIRYGQREAPELYPLNKITTFVVIFYGVNDGVTQVSDVMALRDMMPNAITMEVPHPKFNHMDFIIAKNVKQLVYNDIISLINNATHQDTQPSV